MPRLLSDADAQQFSDRQALFKFACQNNFSAFNFTQIHVINFSRTPKIYHDILETIDEFRDECRLIRKSSGSYVFLANPEMYTSILHVFPCLRNHQVIVDDWYLQIFKYLFVEEELFFHITRKNKIRVKDITPLFYAFLEMQYPMTPLQKHKIFLSKYNAALRKAEPQ